MSATLYTASSWNLFILSHINAGTAQIQFQYQKLIQRLQRSLLESYSRCVCDNQFSILTLGTVFQQLLFTEGSNKDHRPKISARKKISESEALVWLAQKVREKAWSKLTRLGVSTTVFKRKKQTANYKASLLNYQKRHYNEVNFQNINWPLTTKGIKGQVLQGKRRKNTFKYYNQKRNETGLKFVLPHLLFSMEVNKRPPIARTPRYHCRTKVPNIEVFTHTQKRKSSSIQKAEVCLCQNTCNHC